MAHDDGSLTARCTIDFTIGIFRDMLNKDVLGNRDAHQLIRSSPQVDPALEVTHPL